MKMGKTFKPMNEGHHLHHSAPDRGLDGLMNGGQLGRPADMSVQVNNPGQEAAFGRQLAEEEPARNLTDGPAVDGAVRTMTIRRGVARTVTPVQTSWTMRGWGAIREILAVDPFHTGA